MSLYAPGGFQATFLNGYGRIHEYNLIPAKIRTKTVIKAGGDYWQNGNSSAYTFQAVELNFQGKSPRTYKLVKQGIVKEGVEVYSVYIKGDVDVDPKQRIIIDDALVDSKMHGKYKVVNIGGDGIIQGAFIFKIFDVILV